MGLTNAQQAAIEQSGKTVLVSAAAGSGKTFTLTKRIIQKIIEEGADISRMLIVTYTRAAAGELKSRISSALSEEIAKHPENPHLQNQMLLIPSAKICTIDSFFTDPVKSNFDKLGLPARIRLVDSAELETLRVDIFTAVLEDMYAKYGITASTKLSDISGRNEFTDLIYLLTNTRNTNKFISLLCSLYNKLVTSPLGVEVLKKNALRLEESAKIDFFSTPEGKVIKRDILQALGTCENAFKYNLSRLDEDAFVKEKYFANFEDNVRKCQNLAHRIEKSDFEHLSTAFEAYNPSKLATISKEDVTPFSEECKEFRAKTHKKVMKIKNDYLAYSVDEIKNTYIELSKINFLLYEIISIFDKKYTQSKKDSGMLEFSDMPRFLLELLGDGSTSVAKEMRDMYDEVYIDEYQDVNEIQDTIFKIIGGTHRFMVGDIKQSIYGFRDAMPELFAAYKNAFPLYTEENTDSDGCTIFMSENFRCDENIINFTNAVCSKLFEASREAINYTKNDDLVFQKMGLPEDYECPDVEINIFDDGQYSDILIENEDEEDPTESIVSEDDVRDTDIPNEAIYCAKEILRLMREEKKPNGAPVSFGDIAILVRVKYHAPIIAATLKKYGIEYCLSASNQLFDGNDMKSLLDLLRVIDNPEDDMALCSFLTTDAYSGEPMLSLEEIVTIRQAAGTKKSMYRALVEYSDITDPLATLLCHRVSIILNILKSLRALSRRVAADKLLRAIKTIPEFYLICESEAYTYIYDCACNYVKRSWNGLYSFLKYYKKLAESGNVTLNEASSTNAVNIMTIHQSKGLEYHTVFLFGCSRQFSQKESRASLNYSRQLCVATKTLLSDIDEDGKSYICGTSANIIKNAVVKSIYNDSLLEEMRVLYVGLTRARERLYISATIKESYGDFSNRMKMIGCDPSSIMKQKSFIEWICSSLGEDAPDDLKYNVNVYSALKMPDLMPASDDKNKPMINATESELSLVNAINSTSNVSEGEKLISLIPSKVAASKASPSMLDNTVAIHKNGLDSERDAEAIRSRIQLMSSSKKDFDSLLSEAKAPSAADIGTATHSFLQLCDFERVAKTSIKEEIELLVERKFISRECADMINISQIKKFFESKLFSDIQKAYDLRKEFKFGIYRPASEFTNDESLSKIFANRNIYVQGAIDLILFFSDGSIHVCDYKTDRLEAGERENISLFCKRMRDRHKDQLYQYKVAIEQIFGKSPDKMYIYSLPLGETVEINV